MYIGCNEIDFRFKPVNIFSFWFSSKWRTRVFSTYVANNQIEERYSHEKFISLMYPNWYANLKSILQKKYSIFSILFRYFKYELRKFIIGYNNADGDLLIYVAYRIWVSEPMVYLWMYRYLYVCVSEILLRSDIGPVVQLVWYYLE